MATAMGSLWARDLISPIATSARGPDPGAVCRWSHPLLSKNSENSVAAASFPPQSTRLLAHAITSRAVLSRSGSPPIATKSSTITASLRRLGARAREAEGDLNASRTWHSTNAFLASSSFLRKRSFASRSSRQSSWAPTGSAAACRWA